MGNRTVTAVTVAVIVGVFGLTAALVWRGWDTATILALLAGLIAVLAPLVAGLDLAAKTHAVTVQARDESRLALDEHGRELARLANVLDAQLRLRRDER
jgi:hypothetical protein